MAYTLQNFCSDAHNAIARDNNHIGREKVRQKLAFLLGHPEFISEYLLKQKTSKITLYHDKEYDFYVMAHAATTGDRIGKPHDHGRSWAVYGQATGITNMTVWDRMDDRRKINYAKLVKGKKFSLTPGEAALFDTGVIHSTAHPEPARWVRVTGANLDTIERFTYNPEKNFCEPMNLRKIE